MQQKQIGLKSKRISGGTKSTENTGPADQIPEFGFSERKILYNLNLFLEVQNSKWAIILTFKSKLKNVGFF